MHTVFEMICHEFAYIIPEKTEWHVINGTGKMLLVIGAGSELPGGLFTILSWVIFEIFSYKKLKTKTLGKSEHKNT